MVSSALVVRSFGESLKWPCLSTVAPGSKYEVKWIRILNRLNMFDKARLAFARICRELAGLFSRKILMLSFPKRMNVMRRFEIFESFGRTTDGQAVLQLSKHSPEMLDEARALMEAYKEACFVYDQAGLDLEGLAGARDVAMKQAEKGMQNLRNALRTAYENDQAMLNFFKLKPKYHRTRPENEASDDESLEKEDTKKRVWESLAQKRVDWPYIIESVKSLTPDELQPLTALGWDEARLHGLSELFENDMQAYRTWESSVTETSELRDKREKAWDVFYGWFKQAARTTRSNIKCHWSEKEAQLLRYFGLEGELTGAFEEV